MLNKNWKKHDYEKDLNIWNRIDMTTPPFLFENIKEMNNLLYEYFVGKKSEHILGPGFSLYQKLEILRETMRELEYEAEMEKKNKIKNWHQQRDNEESLDAKLEREEDMYQRANIKLSNRIIL